MLLPNSDPYATPVSARFATRMSRDMTTTQLPMSPDPATPEWWLKRLHSRMSSRLPQVETYEAYYDGQHRLAFATEKFREAFGNLFAAFADNWCDLVVDASVERLGIEGFHFGQGRASRFAPADSADSDAWDIWQANGLDADSDLAHTESVKLGEAYLLVTPSERAGEPPVIQVEHPACAIVECNAARPRERLAGLRVWADIVAGVETAVLYLPDEVYWWARPLSARGTAAGGWEIVADQTGRNTLGVVPIIPIRNRVALRDRCGRSDLARVIPMQDAINKLVTDMIVASEFAAYPQRWAVGLDIPVDADGKPLPGFEPGSSRLWAAEDVNVKWGEFTASDLSNYVRAVEALIQHVAAQTRTPPHYLLGQSGNFPSGESLKATETGLVAKVKRKQLWFGEAWEDAMRLAFRIQGSRKAFEQNAETIWRDPESRSEAERTDALVKMATLGVPKPALWKRWGATPQEIEQWLAAYAAEQAQNPTPQPPSAPVTGAEAAANGSTPAPPAPAQNAA